MPTIYDNPSKERLDSLAEANWHMELNSKPGLHMMIAALGEPKVKAIWIAGWTEGARTMTAHTLEMLKSAPK